MNKLDDLLSKKKTVIPVLDLSKNLPQSKEELKRLMEKVPDYKMRPIRVKGEEIKIKEKDYSFKPSKKEIKKLLKKNGKRDLMYMYMNPIPLEMREIILTDLYTVPIDWKMLTTLRPKTKIEEEYFSRLVEMGKLQLKSEIRDKKENQLNPEIKKIKNKSGIVETRLIACPECGEELCNGLTCMDFNYDLFVRIELNPPKPKPHVKSSNNKSIHSKKKISTSLNKRKIKKSSSTKSPIKKDTKT